MPIEVRIDVIPHGVEAMREKLADIRITQVAKFDDDPGGERLYFVQRFGRAPKHTRIRHHRSDGAETLVRKALEGLEK